MAKEETIVLLGGTGALGQFISAYFRSKNYKVSSLSSRDFPITPGQHHRSLELLPAMQPALVVNLAGFVRDLSLSKPREQVLDLNGIFPQNAAKFFHDREIPFIHISTDCVFSGTHGPYDEMASCDADDIYGASKAMGDTAPGIILRGSYLGPGMAHSTGLFDWILAKRESTVGAFTNQYWNGITYLKLAEVTEFIYVNKLFEPTIYHLPSSKAMSRFDLIAAFSSIFQLNITPVPEISKRPVSRTLATRQTSLLPCLAEPINSQLERLRDWLIADHR